jgi:hypothetical protein
MNPELTLSIQQALKCTISADQTLAAQSEQFLTVDQKTNPQFYVSLLAIVIDPAMEEAVRIAGCLVLKKHIEKGFLELPQEIQTFVQTHIIPATFNCGSLKVGKQLVECFSKLLLKLYPEKWPTLEEELLGHLKDPALTIDRLYFVLKLYVKLAQNNEWTEVSHKSDFLKTVPAFLAALAVRTQEILASPTDQKPLFLAIVCKILTKLFRVNDFSYFHQPETSAFWFDTLFRAIHGNYGDMRKPIKWLVRFYVNFFRRTTESVHVKPKKGKKKAQAAEGVTALQTFNRHWQDKFFESTMHVLSVFNAKEDDHKIAIACSRVFLYATGIEELMVKYHSHILGLAKEKVIGMLSFSQSQLEDFNDNPVELVRSLDEFYHEDNCRGAALQILTSLGQRQAFLMDLLNHIYQQIQLINLSDPQIQESSWVYKESLYYLTEKLVRQINRLAGSDEVVVSMVSTHIIPDMDSRFPLIKTRVCNLLKVLLTTRLDQPKYEPFFKDITQKLCTIVTDPYLPVKGSAAMALALFLDVKSVENMIRPHIQTILQIYVNLINDCDSEQLINALNQICRVFAAEVTPYVSQLISNMSQLIIRIKDKREKMDIDKEQDDMEEQTFSILSIYQTMFELVSTLSSTATFGELVGTLTTLTYQALKLDDVEDLSEILSIFTLMAYKCPVGGIVPELWPFFEFVCLTLVKPQTLPEAYTHPLKEFIGPTLFTVGEFGSGVIYFLRNFINRGWSQMLALTTVGGTYLDLFMSAVQVLKNEPESGFEMGTKFYASVLEANVALELVSRPDLLQHYSLIPKNIEASLKGYTADPSEVQGENWLAHNIGLCFAVDFKGTLEALAHANFVQNLLKSWVAFHKKQLTFRSRKGSFLGLLSVCKNMGTVNLVAQSGLDEVEFLSFLMTEIIALDTQYKLETDMEGDDDEDLDDDDDDDEEGEDFKKEEAPVSLVEGIEAITDRIDQLNHENDMAVDQMLQFEYEYCEDAFEKVNHIEAFKACMQEVCGARPQVYEQALAALGETGVATFKGLVEPKPVA